MKTISTEELRDQLEAGKSPLFDVRGDVEFEIGHIPGAKTAPLGSLAFRVKSLMNSDSMVTVYSGGGDCTLAAQAAERLENLGMTNIRCYHDGLAGWRKAGNPVVASVNAKLHTQGESRDCRDIVVDRDSAYGGAFSGKPNDEAVAGG